MPAAIGAAIIAGVAATTGVTIPATAFTIGTTAIASADLIGSAVLIAGSIALSALLAPDVPKPADGHQSTRQAIPPRVKGYGRCRISGAYMLYEQAEGVSYDVLALSQGPIAGIVGMLLNDDIVQWTGDPFGGYASVTGCQETNDGRYLDGDGNPVVLWSARRGLATETAYADIAAVPELAGIWDATHRGDGIASVSFQCLPVSQNDVQTSFPSGLPNPSWVVDFPQIWDFRDPAQDPTDPATWVAYPAWSAATTYASGVRVVFEGATYLSVSAGNLDREPGTTRGWWTPAAANPVLQVVDYLILEMGLDRDTLVTPVLPKLAAEAAICDELIQRADGDDEPRYSSRGWYGNTDPADVVASILSTCDGWMSTNGDGSLALTVGKYRDAGVVLSTKHILSCKVEYGLADEDVTNELKVTFTSNDHKYKQIDAQPWRDETSISTLGKVRSDPLDLTWVQSHPQARRLAKRKMAQLQAPLRGTIVTTLYGLVALGKRWPTIDYGLVSGLAMQAVQVQRCETDLVAGRVTIDWITVDPATIDAWDAATEEGRVPPTPDDAGPLSLPDLVITTVSLINTTANGVQIEIRFADPDRADLTYAMRYRLQDDGSGHASPWVRVMVADYVSDGTTITILSPVVTGNNTLIVEAAVVGSGGTVGPWSGPYTLATVDPNARVTESGAMRITEAGTLRIKEA